MPHNVPCPAAALITAQSGALDTVTKDDKHEWQVGPLTGNLVRMKESKAEMLRRRLNSPFRKVATTWRFAAPFATKCSFVLFQWSCNSVISGRTARTQRATCFSTRTDEPISLHESFLFFLWGWVSVLETSVNCLTWTTLFFFLDFGFVFYHFLCV